MKIIGVTGGICCGKSTVSRILKERGAYIIDADEINHKLMLRGNSAYNEIIDYFGNSIVGVDGEINRKTLGYIVFSDKTKLSKLTEITHKYIIAQTFSLIKEISEKANNKINDFEYSGNFREYRFVVIDAPLLIEAGLNKICDEVWLIISDINFRIDRIVQRDNVSKLHAEKVIGNQTPVELLKEHADVVIENNFNLAYLHEIVAKLIETRI